MLHSIVFKRPLIIKNCNRKAVVLKSYLSNKARVASLKTKIQTLRKEIDILQTNISVLNATELDILEELFSSLSDLKRDYFELSKDPLESFCADNPDADECKMYDV